MGNQAVMAVNFKQCPVCDAPIRVLWPTVAVWRCTNCKLLMRNPQPTEQELGNLYDGSWTAPEENSRETGGTNSYLAGHYAAQLLHSLRLPSFAGLTILDFGAGRGATAAALASLGARVVAVEPFGYAYLQQRGISVFQQLADIPQGTRFDGIVSIDVIEHLPTPVETIGQLGPYLSDNGWLFLATPNAAGISCRVKRAAWKEVRNPGHLYLFSPQNLELLLSKAGYSRPRRLRWYIQYSANPARRALHTVLQSFAVDGELRYLAYKS